jgi:hypothetical protein
VSRGIGNVQREVVAVLWDQAKSRGPGIAGGMPLGLLKRAVDTDRSNARRAIRGLMDRGLLEEITGEEGERRVKLTGGAHLALWLATEYTGAELTLERVPSRPVVLDAVYSEVEPLHSPHESLPTPCVSEAFPDPPVSDNLDHPMRAGTPHTGPPRRRERAVSDNEANDPARSNPMKLGQPHEPSPLSSDRGVSDNGASEPERGYPMQMRPTHANAGGSEETPVRDNRRGGSLALEMYRRILAGLDDMDGEDER